MGNKRFRETINAKIKDYIDAPNRYEKSLVVHGVVEQIQASGGRFLKYDEKTGNWYELSNSQMKEKVGHAIRDAVNALEARVERKRMSETKEDREPDTSSPAPAASVRDKESPSSALGYKTIMNEPSESNHAHFRSPPAAFESSLSQQMLYHQQPSPSDQQQQQRPFQYPPFSFQQQQQRYRLFPRHEEYHHPSCLHDGSAHHDHHNHHPNLIEPIPYPPVASTTSDLLKKTYDVLQVVPPSDASAMADTTCPKDVGEDDQAEHVSSHDKDPFLEQINQVLGPDDTEESCVSI